MTAIEFTHQIVGYQNRLQNFALSLVANQDDAHDLVQETYLRAITYREKVTDYSNLIYWVMRIMKNIFINSYRRKNKSRDIINEKIALQKNDSHSFESTESYYTQNEIKNSIKELSEDIRIPFTMYVDGFKYREIADELNINIGTVKSRIFTARQQLMKSLDDFK